MIAAHAALTPNGPPVAVDDTYNIHRPGYIGYFTTNDSDPENDSLSFSITAQPTHGSLYFDGGAPNAHPWYTPFAGYTGPDYLTYKICDPFNLCDTARVTINIVNAVPVAVDDTYNVHRPGYIGYFTANDIDTDNDSWTFTILTQPTHGSLYFDGGAPNPRPWYTPFAGYTGPDSMSYKICDSFGGCDTAMVTINIVNAVPVAVDDTYNVHRPGYIGYFTANDIDTDNDSWTFTIISEPTRGSLYFDGGAPNARPWYTPFEGYAGPDSMSYKICDSFGGCDTAMVTINIVNDPPIAVDDKYTVTGAGYIGSFTANDINTENDSLAFSITTAPAHGSLYFDGGAPNPRPWYTPEAGYSGTDFLAYQICDNFGACSSAGVYINDDDSANAGEVSCNSRRGEPVNVTNGNMYLQQTDYNVPALDGTRTYNSNSAYVNLFGLGWSTVYDENIRIFGSNNIRLFLPDGRSIDLERTSSSGAFVPVQGDFHGQVVQNADGYTLSLKDGSVHRFNAAGKLLTLADRNGNQTALTYDANNLLVSVANPFGRTLSVTTDANGRILTLSDSLGTIATYAYGGNNELQSVTYPDGSMFQFAYVFSPRLVLTSVTDALGNVLESHTYDALGRALTSEKQGGVERVTFNYISDTETDVTDALNRLTKFFFDKSRGRNVVTKVEGMCSCGGSQSQTWTYDGQLNVTAMTNALNQATTYTYDENGNQLTETDVLGTRSYTYNSLGQVLTSTDVMNGVTTSTYDARGNLLSVKDNLGYTTSFTYDARGLLLTVTDARAKVTTFAYNATGDLTQKTDAAAAITKFAYDARGRVTSTTDALGKVTSFGYDDAGRVNKITASDASFVTFTYDLAGRRTAVTDARNNSTSYAYDGAYRLTSETDALGGVRTYSYNLMSYPTGYTDALGNLTNYEYDDYNRITKKIYPQGVPGGVRITKTYAYDAAGNLIKSTDQAARSTSYEYDAANRLVKVTDPALKVTQYEYNGRSQMTAVIDALNQRYDYTYDSLGRLTQTTRGGVSMSYVYDAMGNRTQRTDYNGARTTYAFDAVNRIIKITYPNAITSVYTYNKLSRLLTATNATGKVTLHYNGMMRVDTTTDVFGQVLNYTFDANGNRTAMSFDTTTAATYQYDPLNRLTTITDGAGAVFGYGYDATGKVSSRTLPNGIVSTYQYNGVGRLMRLQDTLGATTIADTQYKYSAPGYITQQIDLGGTHAYTYDNMNRLLGATYPGQTTESYRYDAVGNRTTSHLSASHGYQPFNKLVSTSTGTYSYDNNGNMLTKTDSTGTWAYTWDYENRLTQATRQDGVTVSYKYDALGRRVQRTPSNAASTNYIYDGQEVVKDIISDGNAVDYLNGPGIDNKLRQTRTPTGRTFYYTQDHLGSTKTLTDTTGAVWENMTYDSFGGGAGNVRTRYGYMGRERDELTGLYYYRARWYDPQVGRFTSEDPIAFEGGVNWYAFVSNSPVNFTDPSGLCPQQTQGPEFTPDACGDMASFAQSLADAAAFKNKRDEDALREFDREYSRLYVGHPMYDLLDVLDLMANGPQDRTQIRFHFGQTGFKNEFKEMRKDNGRWQIAPDPQDQTHHFVTMLSAGINSRYFASAIHNIGDNPGDQRLTNAAYDIGVNLRKHPWEITDIGDIIRRVICDSGRKPAH
jgi:RHS repeat-associated protein